MKKKKKERGKELIHDVHGDINFVSLASHIISFQIVIGKFEGRNTQLLEKYENFCTFKS